MVLTTLSAYGISNKPELPASWTPCTTYPTAKYGQWKKSWNEKKWLKPSDCAGLSLKAYPYTNTSKPKPETSKNI
jgi:uxuA: mannonate dehydratase